MRQLLAAPRREDLQSCCFDLTCTSSNFNKYSWRTHNRRNEGNPRGKRMKRSSTHQQGCQRHMLQSVPPVASSCPARLKDIEDTELLWPASVQRGCAARRSHSWTLPSTVPLATVVPSGLHTTFVTPDAALGMMRHALPSLTSHILTVRSPPDPDNIKLQLGCHATESTSPWCPTNFRNGLTCSSHLHTHPTHLWQHQKPTQAQPDEHNQMDGYKLFYVYFWPLQTRTVTVVWQAGCAP